jgi:uncharacterized lipoprotein
MRWLLILAGLVLMVGVVAACGSDSKEFEQFKDAERGTSNTESADTITFPDGFSNVATKCDHGNRVYVLFKGSGSYGSIAVVPDAKGC